jgi:hypothetical protein
VTNPLDDLMNFAQRSYVRMQAEQLITECLQLGRTKPFDDLLESLVMNGAGSLLLLREILDEILDRKSLLSQEGLGVRQDLMDALSAYGVYLPQLLSADAPDSFRRICSNGLRKDVSAASQDLNSDDEALLEEICVDASRRVTTVARQMMMINGIESSVRDWIGSIAYEVAKSPDPEVGPVSQPPLH